MPSKANPAVEKKEKEFSFEQALERLEKIVQALESGELSLDQSLAGYEEGIGLSRQCLAQLAQAEKRVKELTQTAEGLFKLVDAELGEEGEKA